MVVKTRQAEDYPFLTKTKIWNVWALAWYARSNVSDTYGSSCCDSFELWLCTPSSICAEEICQSPLSRWVTECQRFPQEALFVVLLPVGRVLSNFYHCTSSFNGRSKSFSKEAVISSCNLIIDWIMIYIMLLRFSFLIAKLVNVIL